MWITSLLCVSIIQVTPTESHVASFENFTVIEMLQHSPQERLSVKRRACCWEAAACETVGEPLRRRVMLQSNSQLFNWTKSEATELFL